MGNLAHDRFGRVGLSLEQQWNASLAHHLTHRMRRVPSNTDACQSLAMSAYINTIKVTRFHLFGISVVCESHSKQQCTPCHLMKRSLEAQTCTIGCRLHHVCVICASSIDVKGLVRWHVSTAYAHTCSILSANNRAGPVNGFTCHGSGSCAC